MNIDKNAVKKQRERRFFLFLPMVILPFIIFLCWKMGAGQPLPSGKISQQSGLLTELPGAKLLVGDSRRSKLELYALAKRDSLKLQELMRSDPYHTSLLDTTDATDDAFSPELQGQDFAPSPASQTELTTSKIYEKLGLLQQQIDLPQQATWPAPTVTELSGLGAAEPAGEQSKEDPMMEHILSQNFRADSTEDREINQLNGMLDKVLDIQYPERMAGRRSSHEDSISEGSLTIRAAVGASGISSLEARQRSGQENRQEGFFSPGDSLLDQQHDLLDGSVPAVVDGQQELSNGAILKLRLQQPVEISRFKIPRGHPVFGRAELQGDRMEVKVKNVLLGQRLLPVDLIVYDLNGIRGIYVPGSMSSESLRESSDRALQELSVGSLDQTLEARAARLGVQATKNLFSKKTKLLKVTLTSGYRVLLVDQKQQQAASMLK